MTRCLIFIFLGVCVISIIAQADAGAHEFPYLAAIFSKVNGTVSLYCSASIVHPSYLLTAAHCLDTPIDHVRVGNTDFKYGIRYEVATVYKHEDYIGEKNLFKDDIALVEIKNAILSANGVSTIHLSTKRPEYDEIGNISVVGYGFMPVKLKHPSHKGPIHVDDFHKDLPPKAQNAILHEKHTQIACGTKYPIQQICFSQIYLGSIIQRDNGGPLIFSDGEKHHQIGISSSNSYNVWTRSKVEITTIFTRIRAYCDWIAQKTNNKVNCD
uniref:Peptidase S1 domain-containing protein n=1 Tax=Panagrellus redivivus TaxID=6233 RepID=A0A7E4ZWT6_PANRE